KENPGKREAQKRLAEEMTKFVHDEAALEQAIKISVSLLSVDLKQLSAHDISTGFKDVPTYEVENTEIGSFDLLVQAGICPSKRQAREDINNGAIYVNGERNQDVQHVLNTDDRIEDKYTIIRRGKKKYTLIQYK